MMNSQKCWNLLKSVIPNGCQTLSKMPNRYVDGVYPKVLDCGRGGRVYDVDGNDYIDLIAGLGAVSLGHTNLGVAKVVMKQLTKGVSFSLPNMIEYELACKLIELLPHTDMWKFTKTGSDACTMAVTCARAYTGKTKILSCGYHGWHGWYSILNDKKAGIPPNYAQDIHEAYYNNLESFEKVLSGRYAAVIMEPMVFDLPEPKFLATIREWCTQSNTLLIFDEVVTGGRFPTLTAQNYLGVKPDLTVLSKGIANGFPLAVVGGKRHIMKTFEREDVFVSTTFGGEAVSMVACIETLTQLKDKILTMLLNGIRIKETFNKMYFDTGAVCKGYPTRLTFDFPTKELKALFMQEMCKRRILVGYSNLIMADHTERDIDQICAAIVDTAQIIKSNWNNPKLEGALPVEALRMR